MKLPARCPQCKLVFEAETGISVRGGSVGLQGSKVPCPECGQLSPLLDGVFAERNDKTEFVTGPQRTRELFELLQTIIEQSKARGDAPEQTLQEIKKQAPEAFSWLISPKVIGAMAVLGGAGAVVGIVTGILQVVLAMRPTGLSEEDLTRVASRVVAEQCGHVDPPKIHQQLPHANPHQHGGDAAKRVQQADHHPDNRQRERKKRPKREP